jgi:hypothetical protein
MATKRKPVRKSSKFEDLPPVVIDEPYAKIIVHAAEMREIFGVSEKTLAVWAKENLITRVGFDRFDLKASISSWAARRIPPSPELRRLIERDLQEHCAREAGLEPRPGRA